MAESNNLDDLILTEPENESNRKKGLLVLLGLVVLLAIIGVVLTNVIMNAGDDNNTTEVVKDEIVHNTPNELTQDKKNLDTALDDDLAPLDEQDMIAKESNPEKESVLKSDDIITGASVVTAGAAAATAATMMHNKIAAKNNLMRDEILEDTPKVEKKKVVRAKEHHVRHVKKKVVHHKPRVKKSVYRGNIYIQVGSFSKGPSSAFINKIRRMGLRYRIKTVNGFRRVLVGPFRSISEAKRVLPKVRAYISPNAFIKR